MTQKNNGTAIVPEQSSAFETADKKRYEKLATSAQEASEKRFSYPDIPGTDDLLESLGLLG